MAAGSAPRSPASQRWLRAMLAFLVGGLAAQVALAATMSYLGGRYGAVEWLENASRSAARAADATIRERLDAKLRSALDDQRVHAAIVRAMRANGAAGDAARDAIAGALHPLADDGTHWLVDVTPSAPSALATDLPCGAAALRSLRRLPRESGFIDCDERPMLATSVQPLRGVTLWALQDVADDYVDLVHHLTLVEVQIVSDRAVLATSLRGEDDARAIPQLPAHLASGFHRHDLELAQPYAGFPQPSAAKEDWHERGATTVAMFSELRPLGDESSARVMFLAPVSLFFLGFQSTTVVLVAFGAVIVLVMALLAKRFASRVSRPLVDLTQTARAIAAGDRDRCAVVTGDDEVGSLAHSFNAMVEQLQKNDTRLRGQERLATVGELAAGIALEMNTPLQVLTENTAYLAESTRELASHDKEIPLALRDSAESISRIHQLASALLALTRTPVAAEHASLRSSIETALRLCAHECRQLATVEIDAPTDVPTPAMPSNQLVQVLLELVRRSARGMSAASGGHIKIRVYPSHQNVLVRLNVDGRSFAADEHVLSAPRADILARNGATLAVDPVTADGTTVSLRLPTLEPERDRRVQ